MRLFVGIAADGDTVRELTALRDKLGPAALSLRWSKPEAWHVTLQFLGNANEDQLECLKVRLAEIRAAPVPVRLDGFGVFKGPGILYAGVQLAPELAALQRRVVAATAQCGFVAEDRPYRPHFTLARAKDEAGRRELKRLMQQVGQRVGGSASQRVSAAAEFLLYESHAEVGGTRYEVRARFALSTPAG